jgi:hypothetical protein
LGSFCIIYTVQETGAAVEAILNILERASRMGLRCVPVTHGGQERDLLNEQGESQHFMVLRNYAPRDEGVDKA